MMKILRFTDKLGLFVILLTLLIICNQFYHFKCTFCHPNWLSNLIRGTVLTCNGPFRCKNYLVFWHFDVFLICYCIFCFLTIDNIWVIMFLWFHPWKNELGGPFRPVTDQKTDFAVLPYEKIFSPNYQWFPKIFTSLIRYNEMP